MIVPTPAPVPALPRTPDAKVGVLGPGWFHEGATRPSFLAVDVSATQQFPYDQFEHVTCDMNPRLMFRARDLEFNAMTKYFYTDRSMPKKRLGQAGALRVILAIAVYRLRTRGRDSAPAARRGP